MASSAAPSPSAIQSPLRKGRSTYQVRFFFLPKPRSSMALEITSTLARLDMMRGRRMLTLFLRRLMSLSFLPSSCLLYTSRCV